MRKLRKVVINSRNPAEFGKMVVDTVNTLPLKKIALVLVIDSKFLDPEKNQSHLLEWEDLDIALCRIPTRSEGKPLRFYVIGDNKYHNENWTDLLPRFTERPDVEAKVLDPRLFDGEDTGWGV